MFLYAIFEMFIQTLTFGKCHRYANFMLDLLMLLRGFKIRRGAFVSLLDNAKCNVDFDYLSHVIKCLGSWPQVENHFPLRVGIGCWISIVGSLALFFLVLSYHSRPQSSSESQSPSHVFNFNSRDVGRASNFKWHHHFVWYK